jgi:hypothetical protein
MGKDRKRAALTTKVSRKRAMRLTCLSIPSMSTIALAIGGLSAYSSDRLRLGIHLFYSGIQATWGALR